MAPFENGGNSPQEAVDAARNKIEQSMDTKAPKIGTRIDTSRAEELIAKWTQEHSTDYNGVKMFNEPPTPEEILAALWEGSDQKTRGAQTERHEPQAETMEWNPAVEKAKSQLAEYGINTTKSGALLFPNDRSMSTKDITDITFQKNRSGGIYINLHGSDGSVDTRLKVQPKDLGMDKSGIYKMDGNSTGDLLSPLKETNTSESQREADSTQTKETPGQAKDRVTQMLKWVESQLKELWFGIEGNSMIMPNWEKLPLEGNSQSIDISKERSPDGNTYIDVTNTDGSKDRLTLSRGADGKEPGVYLDGQLYSTSDLLSKQASPNYKVHMTSGPEPKAHFTGKMRGE